jgi:hypothetical protein
LGDDLDTDQYQERVERVAAHLAADVATPLGDWLAQARRCERLPRDEAGDVKLRSLAGDWFEGVDPTSAQTLAAHLLAAVSRLWLTEEKRVRLPADGSTEGAPVATFDELVAQQLAPLENVRVAPQIVAHAQHYPPAILTTERSSPAAQSLVQGIVAVREQLRELRSAAAPATRIDDLAASMKVDKGDLQSRLSAAATSLERSVFERFLPQVFARSGQNANVPSLARVLDDAARREALAIVQALKPGIIVGVDGQLRPQAAAVVKHFVDRQPPPSGWQASRRTYVLKPSGLDLEAPLASGLGRPCTVVDGESTQAILCDELHNLSLAQVTHSLTAGSAEIRDVALKIHTRADIEWTEPPRVVVE